MVCVCVCVCVYMQGHGTMNSDVVIRVYTEVLFWKGDKRKQEAGPESSVSTENHTHLTPYVDVLFTV